MVHDFEPYVDAEGNPLSPVQRRSVHNPKEAVEKAISILDEGRVSYILATSDPFCVGDEGQAVLSPTVTPIYTEDLVREAIRAYIHAFKPNNPDFTGQHSRLSAKGGKFHSISLEMTKENFLKKMDAVIAELLKQEFDS